MSKMSAIDALLLQAEAIREFQSSGEAIYTEKAEMLSKISGVLVGSQGEIIPRLDATFISKVSTENTGGGCMVDFITLTDGRVVTLNDEAICVFDTKESFFNNEGDTALCSMWIPKK